jgi:1,2-dihydroxy-3-keto-5-methylthiopentene dioxygenase
MVKAWYMDDSEMDQRLEHQKNPSQPIDIKDVFTRTGVLYWKVYYDIFHKLIIKLFRWK